MRRTRSIAAFAGILCLATLAGASAASAQQWQVDAKYCFGDTQAPGQAYRTTCKDHDQFDSILACEKAAGDENAAERVRMAGPDNLNTFIICFIPIPRYHY